MDQSAAQTESLYFLILLRDNPQISPLILSELINFYSP